MSRGNSTPISDLKSREEDMQFAAPRKCVFGLPLHFVVFLLLVLASDAFLAAYRLFWDFNRYVETLMVGSFAGQLCAVAVLAGLFGRSWLAGYLLSILLATAMIAACVSSIEIANGFRYSIEIDFVQAIENGGVPALLVPSMILAAAAPCLCMRALFGWQLVAGCGATQRIWQDNTSRSGQLSGVSGLLILTAIVAGCLITAQSAEVIFDGSVQGVVFALLVACLVLAAASAAAVLPALYVAYRLESYLLRLYALMGMGLSTALLSVSLLWIVRHPSLPFSPGGISADELWQWGFLIPLFGASFFIVFLYCLRWSGFDLLPVATKTKSLRTPTESADVTASTDSTPFDDTEMDCEDARFRAERGQHWMLATATFLLLCIGPLCGGIAELQRANRLSRLAELRIELAAKGGELRLYGFSRIVDAVDLPPDVPVAWIQQLGDLTSVRELKLAGRKLSDSDLEFLGQLSGLERLDLSNSDFSDQHAASFEQLSMLSRVDVSGTALTNIGIENLLRNPNIQHLGAADLTMDWSRFCDSIRARPDFSFRVGGPGLTNLQVKHLLSTCDLISGLDVRGSPIDESALIGKLPTTLTRLNLNGTKISDSAFSALLPSLPITDLSVANTQLSDEILPFLSTKHFQSLDLSEAQVTDEGLSRISPAKWTAVKLSIPNLTGDFLRVWLRSPLPLLEHLDLSGSSIGDSAFTGFKNQNLQAIDLSNTLITEATLMQLQAPTDRYLHVNIRGCKIDVRKLLGSVPRLILACDLGQFTEDEQQVLRSFATLAPGVELPFHRSY
ncbi:MAG: leucine-rich repeat domain-containing protein [Pirellulaceae bacterium]